eukprot:m.18275 g.18275  ORF g.18275 m.18275 type:complete len:243 (-) comp8121_c0_seq1:179-907(-)
MGCAASTTSVQTVSILPRERESLVEQRGNQKTKAGTAGSKGQAARIMGSESNVGAVVPGSVEVTVSTRQAQKQLAQLQADAASAALTAVDAAHAAESAMLENAEEAIDNAENAAVSSTHRVVQDEQEFLNKIDELLTKPVTGAAKQRRASSKEELNPSDLRRQSSILLRNRPPSGAARSSRPSEDVGEKENHSQGGNHSSHNGADGEVKTAASLFKGPRPPTMIADRSAADAQDDLMEELLS